MLHHMALHYLHRHCFWTLCTNYAPDIVARGSVGRGTSMTSTIHRTTICRWYWFECRWRFAFRCVASVHDCAWQQTALCELSTTLLCILAAAIPLQGWLLLLIMSRALCNIRRLTNIETVHESMNLACFVSTQQHHLSNMINMKTAIKTFYCRACIGRGTDPADKYDCHTTTSRHISHSTIQFCQI